MIEPPCLDLLAGELNQAIKTALRNKRKKVVTLRYAPSRNCLAVLDAQYESTEIEVRAMGHWTEQVQVDGPALQRLLTRYSETQRIQLSPTAEGLKFQVATFKAVLPRLDRDPKKRVKRSSEPAPEHIGPVYPKPAMMGGKPGEYIQVKRGSEFQVALEEVEHYKSGKPK